jgi:hypothetical protein
VAGEYGTKNAAGEDITPASNKITFKKANTELETILTAEQAGTYTMEYVLGDWAATAKQQTKQLEVSEAYYADGNLNWKAVDGAIAYLVEKNGEFVAITTDATLAVTIDAEKDALTVRAANSRGGFGPAVQASFTGTGIHAINAAMERGEQVVYNLAGQRVNKTSKGLYIVNGQKVAVK